MTKNYAEITRDLNQGVAAIDSALPEVIAGFRVMADAAKRDGALDEKTKELIALAIGVASRCDGCIGFHTRALARLGASREEVTEALGVAIYMGGGPSLMFAAEAIGAFDSWG